MRVGRLELPRAQCPTDFKSGASTDSAILARHYTYPNVFLNQAPD